MLSSCQFIEQRLGLFQIERVEAFSEPAVDRSEKIARLIPLALIAPETGEAHRRAQFPGLCLLIARNKKSVLETLLRLRSFPLKDGNYSGGASDFRSP